jgi:hypothetical protein
VAVGADPPASPSLTTGSPTNQVTINGGNVTVHPK